MKAIEAVTTNIEDSSEEKICNQNTNGYKWINFPAKIDLLVNLLMDYNIDMMDRFEVELLSLIGIFAFGVIIWIYVVAIFHEGWWKKIMIKKNYQQITGIVDNYGTAHSSTYIIQNQNIFMIKLAMN